MLGVEELLRRLVILGEIPLEPLVNFDAGNRGSLDRIDNPHLADDIFAVGRDTVGWCTPRVECGYGDQGFDVWKRSSKESWSQRFKGQKRMKKL